MINAGNFDSPTILYILRSDVNGQSQYMGTCRASIDGCFGRTTETTGIFGC